MAVDWPKRALHPHFGAELEGLKAGPEMSAQARTALLNHVSQAGVVLLRDQYFDNDSLAAFCASLGPPTPIATTRGRDGGVFRLSNLDTEGKFLPLDHDVIRGNRANELWHADHTFVRPRASYSMLYGRIIPPEGGDTQFCDTRRAFERLSASEQARYRAMTAFHSVMHSRKLMGFNTWTEKEIAAYGTPVERALVHRHAESGRDALCLAAYICRFGGMDEAASADLLAQLFAHAAPPEEIYTHHWRVGDLVLWDNRCTMHRATPFDLSRYGREMLAPPRLIDMSEMPAG